MAVKVVPFGLSACWHAVCLVDLCGLTATDATTERCSENVVAQ
jgi:hypothetical protein